MNTKSGLKYSKTHEWLEIVGNNAKVGITDFAQNSLGDIVYVEFPDIGQEIKLDTDFGVIESVKAVSDLIAPLSGTITEINSSLEDTPETINEAPFDSWIIQMTMDWII